jgi:hypothetical protein
MVQALMKMFGNVMTPTNMQLVVSAPIKMFSQGHTPRKFLVKVKES